MVMFLAVSMVCVYLCLLARTFETKSKKLDDQNDDLKISKTNSKCIALGTQFLQYSCLRILKNS